MIRTCLSLNPASAAVRRDLADVYQLHRTVLSLFPATLPDGERVLFRLEEGDWPALCVQSLVDWPDAARLPPGYLLTGAALSSRAVAPLQSDWLHPDAEPLPFRLRANPTKRVDGRRIPLPPEAWGDWLARKGEQSGFRVVDVTAADCGTVVGYRPLDGARPSAGLVQTVSLHAVEFSGVLAVTDPTLLAEAIRAGIGSGKGFGFGLLVVGPD